MMRWSRPKLRWTWRTACLATLGGWLVLLGIFAPGRACWPLLSDRCARHAWDFVGDLVWLRSLDQWQTLFAGLLAVVAAVIGAYFINKQIQQAERLERERQAREFEAARAMLPLHLDALIDYVLECGRTLKSIYTMHLGDASRTQTSVTSFPPTPMDVATFLQGVVLRAPKGTRAPAIRILANLQTLRARLSGLSAVLQWPQDAKNIPTAELDGYVLEAVDLRARCLALLPYARFQHSEIAVGDEFVSTYVAGLREMGFNDNQFPHLFARAKARFLELTKSAMDQDKFP